jgi:hypothetical protein
MSGSGEPNETPLTSETTLGALPLTVAEFLGNPRGGVVVESAPLLMEYVLGSGEPSETPLPAEITLEALLSMMAECLGDPGGEVNEDAPPLKEYDEGKNAFGDGDNEGEE